MVLKGEESLDQNCQEKITDPSSEKMVSDDEVSISLPKSLTKTPQESPKRMNRSLSKDLRGMEISQLNEKSTVEHGKINVEMSSFVIEDAPTRRQGFFINETPSESNTSLVAEDLLSFSQEVPPPDTKPTEFVDPVSSLIKPPEDFLSKNASQAEENTDSDGSSIIVKNGHKRRRFELDSTLSNNSENNDEHIIFNSKNAKKRLSRKKYDAKRKKRQEKIKRLEKQMDKLKNENMQESCSESFESSCSSYDEIDSTESSLSDSNDSELYEPKCRIGVRKLKSKAESSKLMNKKTDQSSSSKPMKKKRKLDLPKAGIVHPKGQENYWHSAVMIAYLLKGYCDFKHYSDIYSSYSEWFPMSANHLTIRDKLKNTVKNYNNQTRPSAYVSVENERNTVVFDVSFKPGRRVEPSDVRDELKKLCPNLNIR